MTFLFDYRVICLFDYSVINHFYVVVANPKALFTLLRGDGPVCITSTGKTDRMFQFRGKCGQVGLFSNHPRPSRLPQGMHAPVVISGPSGCGKSTLLKMLFKNHPTELGYSISHTTRSPRAGEVHGREYHFVPVEVFQGMVKEGGFLEWAIYASHYYGTSLTALRTVQAAGLIPLLDIDLAGVKSIKAMNDKVNARFVFIKTPTLEVLEQRLRDRGTETEASLQSRLAIATKELEYAEIPGAHDLIIVNDDLERAYAQLEAFVFGQPC